VQQAIEVTPELFQETGGGQTRQNNSRSTDCIQVVCTQQSFLASQIKDALLVGVAKHNDGMFRLFVKIKKLTNNWNIFFSYTSSLPAQCSIHAYGLRVDPGYDAREATLQHTDLPSTPLTHKGVS